MADFLGFGSSIPSTESFLGAASAIVDSVIGDFIDNLTGNDKYRKLYEQTEGGGANGFQQYGNTPADRRLWHTIQTDRSQPDYYFLLKYKGKVIQIDFNINPQRETVSEPHGTTTTYTQGGGKVVTSEGMVSKDITIQGTTGLYPGERRTRLPDSGIGSGFEAFKNLQNVFRRYCYLKRYGDLTKELSLIYVNRRRQESWVVEPKIFTSEDAVEHNFHFTYTIQLETLYPYSGAETKGLVERLLDTVPGWKTFDAVAQRLSESVDLLNASAGKISSIVDGFGTTILRRVNSLANSIADVKAGRLPNVANFKRDSVQGLIRELRGVTAALEAAGANDLAAQTAKTERDLTKTLLNDNLYDKSPQSKASTITDTQVRQLTNYTDSTGASVDPADAVAAGNATQRPDAGQTFGGNQSTPTPVAGSAIALQQYIDAKGPNLQTRSSIGGSALDPNGKFQVSRFSSTNEDAVALPPSTNAYESQLNWNQSWSAALDAISPANSDYLTARINDDDSIQTLAFRLLGDSGRWVELVLLNNLTYPYVASSDYIIANDLSNVLPWGGTILYPIPKAQAGQKVRVWRNESSESLRLSPFDRGLGSDILIDKNTGDVVWGPNDLALAYGVENIEQFIRKRVITRKNMLRRSIRLGFSQMVGVSTGASEAIIKAEARSLFFGDERIISSEAVKITESAGRLFITIAVFVRDRQDPVVVTEDISA